ncbi:MAG: FAD-dependent oxidoreductase, partial [Bacteroidota bacterium]
YQEKDCYWIGSTYEREFEDEQPTAHGKAHLAEALENILSVPFEILEHRAAIRPTVMDRRPLLGTHASYPQLSIFNGLGAKGASLGPYWSNEMADFLVLGKPLHPEVDIQRFYPWHLEVFPLNNS